MATAALEFRLSASIENRGKYWAAVNDQFGIAAYGKTGEEAWDRLRKSVDIMLDRLSLRGMEAMREHLSRLRIPSVDVVEPTVVRYEELKRVGSPAAYREPALAAH